MLSTNQYSRTQVKPIRQFTEKLVSNAQLVIRCFEARHLEKIWKESEEYFEHGAKYGQIWLTLLLWNASLPSDKTALPGGEAIAWKDVVVKKLGSMRKELVGCPSNFDGWQYAFNRVMDQSTNSKMSLDMPPNSTANFEVSAIEIIRLMELTIDAIPYHPLFFGKQVQKKGAERTYFIRALKSSFLSETSKPRQSRICELTSVAFGDQVSESTISKRSSNITVHNAVSAIPQLHREFFLDKYLDN